MSGDTSGDDELLWAEITSGLLPTDSSAGDKPSGNTATWLNDIGNGSAVSLNGISDFFGALADIGGAYGTINLIIGWIQGGQADQIQQALQTILDTINQDFKQLNADLAAQQILQRNTILNGYLSPAWARLQSLPAAVNANPPLSSGDRLNIITECLTTLDNLSGQTQPDLVWHMDKDWQIYWTDQGTYKRACGVTETDELVHDAGYGMQDPQADSDGTVFVHTYSLPLYMWAVTIFLTVGMALDPNFLANYEDVIRSAAAFLKGKHDQILAAITPLFPNWIGKGLFLAACRFDQFFKHPDCNSQHPATACVPWPRSSSIHSRRTPPTRMLRRTPPSPSAKSSLTCRNNRSRPAAAGVITASSNPLRLLA